MLNDGSSPEEISVEIRRCLEAILARLHKLMPLTELVTEILSPWGSPELLLERCKDAADYAQLMLQIGRRHKSAEALFMDLCNCTVDIFFDQERQRLDLRGDGSAFHALEMCRYQVKCAILPGLQVIATQQAEIVSGGRKRPPVSTVPRETQHQLLSHSLL